MTEEEKNKSSKEGQKKEVSPKTSAGAARAAVPATDTTGKLASSAPRGDKIQRQKKRRSPRRLKKTRSEFDQKIISIRRVTRVVAGGRRFSFSVSIVLGNNSGSVGVGSGKAGDTALAIEKAVRNAKKHLIKIPLTKDSGISHDVSAKYCSSVVSILPSPGKGIVAGGAARIVLELAGVRGVTAKILSRSKNALNNARASVKALSALKS